MCMCSRVWVFQVSAVGQDRTVYVRRPEIVRSLRSSEMFHNVIQIRKGNIFINCDVFCNLVGQARVVIYIYTYIYIYIVVVENNCSIRSCSFISCRSRPSAKAVSTVGQKTIETLHANGAISNAKSWRLTSMCTTKLERRI